jgi:hypothetical protein
MIDGSEALAVTVSVALELVAEPQPLLTTAWNVAPLSARAVGGVVYQSEVAPGMFSPFFCHW